MGIREKYANRKLLKLEIAAEKRKAKIPSLDSVKKVGIIWEPDETDAYHYLKDYFEKNGVVVRGLCIYSENVEFPTDTNSLTPKDLNWYKFPKPGTFNNFTETSFDILLIIALNQSIPLDFITLTSQAKFKVGWSPNEKNFLDLNINIGENQNANVSCQATNFLSWSAKSKNK